ncbi:potassium channel LctB [Halolactibacillus halophilus]|uniref:LCTB protein n=1 Tax=Halolactibacillus halophilus TaxID=306540 RepID=A0A1I5QNY4_9BACI|nr:potassium channel family protein [Halolactibacillus halophilus]GEM01872.1 LCTB protein [Halolactibacillus halophilus]SFP47974.1 potassium channel LctB [Halolactibacillus halophilus]
MANLLIGAVVVLFIVKFYWFIKHKRYTLTEFSQAMFLRLFLTLFIVFIGFSLIYYSLFLNDYVVVHDTVNNRTISHFGDYLYFSGVTLLSVGYGDLVPVGVAKIFSLLEASLGLLIPSAFFLTAWNNSNQSDRDS